VIAGIVPLVVPGLVLGILGVRRSGQSGEGGVDRLAYWTAIALSVVWACVIAVIVATGSGSPAAGCVGYPASVRAAYAKVISDINAKAPAAAQAADLAGAATKANAAAADTSQIQARDTLFRLVSDLQQVQADVVAKHPVPEDVLASLRADGATFPQSCPG
jgi:Na+/H+-dicarboxylate symporter